MSGIVRESEFAMNILLQRLMARLVRTGNLSITGPNGATHTSVTAQASRCIS